MGEGLFLLDQVESFEKEKDLQKEILGAGFLIYRTRDDSLASEQGDGVSNGRK